MIRFLDLRSQYQAIRAEIDEAVAQVLDDARFVGGPQIGNFEREFAAYQSARFCVGVGNGTDALEIALEALALPRGSHVLVPALTFIASAEAVTRTGHRIVFADVDPATYTVTPETLAQVCGPETRALVAVHLYGHPCDMAALRRFADSRDLKIVEDCAQAHGAEAHGIRVGALGNVGTFSFYPGKNLGAYGDAGAVVTESDSLARQVRMIANHGRIDKYDHVFEGRSSRMDSLQAAVLSVKLRHLEDWIQRRRAIAERYRSGLAGVGDLKLPAEASWARHVYHLFVVRTTRRDQLQAHLLRAGIETGIHYPIALPKLRAYSYLSQHDAPFAANLMDRELLSLPIGEHLTDHEVDQVISATRGFFGD